MHPRAAQQTRSYRLTYKQLSDLFVELLDELSRNEVPTRVATFGALGHCYRLWVCQGRERMVQDDQFSSVFRFGPTSDFVHVMRAAGRSKMILSSCVVTRATSRPKL